ncbi:MAG: hypothetical protein K6F74_01570 [Prevotella sp.]|nr:hypothetical protein [Prevotella sp.]
MKDTLCVSVPTASCTMLSVWQPYFNLQGLRVLNPQHGHIYIKGGRKIVY